MHYIVRHRYVVKLPTAKRGFVLLPCRRVVERRLPGWPASAAWLATMNAWQRRWSVLDENKKGESHVTLALEILWEV